MRRQCELLGLSRASYYYEPATETPENLALMRHIDEVYTQWPFFGSRRMAVWLAQQRSEAVNRKRVQRLMRQMGLEAVYAKPRTSQRHPEHRVWPYLSPSASKPATYGRLKTSRCSFVLSNLNTGPVEHHAALLQPRQGLPGPLRF